MRVAIYARVSKDDMHAENQLDQLRTWASNAGHAVVAEYVDHLSGGKGIEQRHELARLLDDAPRGRFDLVLVWALDRLSREGMSRTVHYLERFSSCGVAFHSYTEPLLDTTNELVRDILIAVLSAVAKQERLRISERTKAGLERVRRDGSKSGKAIGHPTIAAALLEQIRSMSGSSNSIAKSLGVDPKTVRKYRLAMAA